MPDGGILSNQYIKRAEILLPSLNMQHGNGSPHVPSNAELNIDKYEGKLSVEFGLGFAGHYANDLGRAWKMSWKGLHRKGAEKTGMKNIFLFFFLYL